MKITGIKKLTIGILIVWVLALIFLPFHIERSTVEAIYQNSYEDTRFWLKLNVIANPDIDHDIDDEELKSGETLLLYAVKCKSANALRALLQAGASANLPDSFDPQIALTQSIIRSLMRMLLHSLC